jgi:hypothetical protein
MRYAMTATFLILASANAGAWEKPKPTSLANAAGAIWGAIAAAEALIGQCREANPAHASIFDKNYHAYAISASTLKNKVRDLLFTEAKRQNVPEEDLRAFLLKGTRDIVEEVKQMRVTNPAVFQGKCDSLRDVSSDNINAAAALRREFPHDMKMVDEWRSPFD